MTLNQFLTKLRKTPRDWKFIGSRIRRCEGDKYFCPITSLCSKYFRVNAYRDAAKYLKMSSRGYKKVVEAADSNFSAPEFRKKLLKACGLEE